MNNLNLKAVFDMGALHHTLVVGGEYDEESAALVRFTNQDTSIMPVLLTDPDPFEDFPGHQTAIRQKPDTKTDTLSGYVIDNIDIGNQWTIVGGVRFDRFHATFDQPLGTASHFEHTDNVASPRAAVIYKPTDSYSFYD